MAGNEPLVYLLISRRDGLSAIFFFRVDLDIPSILAELVRLFPTVRE
ncbi:MAG: hypothetical protein L6302_00210 [Desulfobacteraceae bacterium]|nr:hypothetical protein [Desulfobacteraceae bacterium]